MNVYKITCITNGKVYIGITKHSIERRFSEHIYCAKQESKFKFHAAIRKYGVENFTVELIDTCVTLAEANEREVYWVSHYDSMNNGYNTTPGGNQLAQTVAGKNIRRNLW